MKTEGCRPANPQPKEIDSSLFAAKKHKITVKKSCGYAPRKCEECRQPLTWTDQQAAPYADGKFLCAVCRADYVELHHPDPFGDDAVPEVMQA